MHPRQVTTPPDLLAQELRREGARPLITWYGANPGERVELSVVTAANWVAKTAGYLADELAIEPGDAVAIEPTLHWLTAVAQLASWSVGARLDPGGEQVGIPLDAMGAGFSRLVAAYPDRFTPESPSGDDAVADAPQLPAGARLLTVLPLDGVGLGWGVVGPLAAGGSVVYSPADASGIEERALAERVTQTVGIELTGIPRLG
jgi:hypothetical protein